MDRNRYEAMNTRRDTDQEHVGLDDWDHTFGGELPRPPACDLSEEQQDLNAAEYRRRMASADDAWFDGECCGMPDGRDDISGQCRWCGMGCYEHPRGIASAKRWWDELEASGLNYGVMSPWRRDEALTLATERINKINEYIAAIKEARLCNRTANANV